MPQKAISQAEARALKKRVDELDDAEENRRNKWIRDYPGGTNIATLTWSDAQLTIAQIDTARLLGHAIVVVNDGHRGLRFYALPIAKVSR